MVLTVYVGILSGLILLKNLEEKRFERVMIIIAIVLFTTYLCFCIMWIAIASEPTNVIRDDGSAPCCWQPIPDDLEVSTETICYDGSLHCLRPRLWKNYTSAGSNIDMCVGNQTRPCCFNVL